MELILASTSPYRRELLARLGVPFRCVSPGVDEAAVRRPEWTPQQLACNLAWLKAEAVSAHFPQAFVIGCDQVVECEGKVFGKPGTRDAAIQQLTELAGKTHTLWTAVDFFVQGGAVTTHLDITRLVMRSLSAKEIERYVDVDQPLDCAGSYKFESRGIALFMTAATVDPTAIIGLPLMPVTDALRAHGFPIP